MLPRVEAFLAREEISAVDLLRRTSNRRNVTAGFRLGNRDRDVGLTGGGVLDDLEKFRIGRFQQRPDVTFPTTSRKFRLYRSAWRKTSIIFTAGQP